MRRLLQILSCSVALAALGLLVTASALASGTSTSAGDQQYVDPLSSTTKTATTQTSAAPPPSTSSTSPSSSTASAGTTAGTTTATTSTSSATPASSGTLPFTGLNIEACLAVGAGLLGVGLVLRRAVAST